jgi:A/G-specific adenine glycosylase
LSEILLQQTRIPIVLQYFEKILKRYPTLQDLVHADASEFVAQWSGIGYYRRARNMLQCAQYVASQNAGKFPNTAELLEKLPGIGKYTAGALSNVCFEKLTPALDGNIIRVLSRIVQNDLPRDSAAFRKKLEHAFMKIGAKLRPSEYFQSLMELGEKVCLPEPKCPECPVRNFCEARRKNTVDRIPRSRIKRRPVTYYWYLLALRRNQHHFYVQNSSREFLKEAWLFPDVLSDEVLSLEHLNHEFQSRWGIRAASLQGIGSVKHTVTFRKVQAHVLNSARFQMDRLPGKWLTSEELKGHPTSSIMHKVFARLLVTDHDRIDFIKS